MQEDILRFFFQREGRFFLTGGAALADVYALEREGFKVEDGIALAARKDAGLTPATLAWVLSEIQIGDDARIPGGITPEELRTFIGDLIKRLTRMAFPHP